MSSFDYGSCLNSSQRYIVESRNQILTAKLENICVQEYDMLCMIGNSVPVKNHLSPLMFILIRLEIYNL